MGSVLNKTGKQNNINVFISHWVQLKQESVSWLKKEFYHT